MVDPFVGQPRPSKRTNLAPSDRCNAEESNAIDDNEDEEKEEESGSSDDESMEVTSSFLLSQQRPPQRDEVDKVYRQDVPTSPTSDDKSGDDDAVVQPHSLSITDIAICPALSDAKTNKKRKCLFDDEVHQPTSLETVSLVSNYLTYKFLYL